MYSVAIYLVDKAYGGPEEGGWWYEHGEPVTELLDGVPEDYQLPRYYHTEEQAVRGQQAYQYVLDKTINAGRRSIGSVLSQGEYRAVMAEGHPKPFPETKPHYE